MPLSDLLVLDLSRVLAGPYCTQLLADLGARVIKIESKAGDDTRRWGPPYVAGESGYYLSVNRGKESVVVDLKDPRGAALVQRLAVQADVIVENFKVGDLARYGLDYASVAAENPAVVYVSITGYGQTGPRAREAGYDAALQAQSGLLAMTGESDGPPVKVGVAWIDVLTGVHAATGALAALRRRDRVGVGAHLDLALLDVALASLVNQAQNTLLSGESPQRLGSAHPNIVPYQAFSSADGDVMIAVGNDAQFARLCELLDRDEWATDERFASNEARVANRQLLVGMLSERVSEFRSAELLSACSAAGVPATPVLTLAEAFEDPQVSARHLLRHAEHPTIGTLPMVASPLWHARGPDGDPVNLGGDGDELPPPPLLGQHTASVLEGDLGLSPEAVAELAASGVVGLAPRVK